MITEVIYGLVAILIENCTGVLIVRTSKNEDNKPDEETALIQVTDQDKLDDFTKFDPTDTIFCEYDPPLNEEANPISWRRSLPSVKTSILTSLRFVFIIQTACGTLIGLLAVVWIFIDLNTANVCINTRLTYYKLPNPMRSIEIYVNPGKPLWVIFFP